MNLKISISLSFLLHLSQFVINAQHSIVSSITDTRSLGMAGCGVAIHNPHNFINNTAHVGLINKNGIYANYKTYYFINGLNQINLQGILSINKNSSFGLQLSHDGSPEFNEKIIGLAYGRKIARGSYIGIQLNSLFRSQIESGNSFTLSPSLGASIQLIPRLTLATQINNPIPIQENNKPIASSQFKIGCNFQVYSQFNILLELKNNSHQPTHLHIGMEYSPIHYFTFRTGYSSFGNINFGASINVKKSLSLELGYEQHQILKQSSALGISYLFNNTSTSE